MKGNAKKKTQLLIGHMERKKKMVVKNRLGILTIEKNHPREGCIIQTSIQKEAVLVSVVGHTCMYLITNKLEFPLGINKYY